MGWHGIGDVGGQKTLRSYWRNYFEKTDALIWVVDATDRLRVDDCREELHGLLQEEVCFFPPFISFLSVLPFALYLSIYPSDPSIHFLSHKKPGLSPTYHTRTAKNLANLGATAAVRGEPPGLREQDGRRGVHGLGGDPGRSRPRGH